MHTCTVIGCCICKRGGDAFRPPHSRVPVRVARSVRMRATTSCIATTFSGNACAQQMLHAMSIISYGVVHHVNALQLLTFTSRSEALRDSARFMPQGFPRLHRLGNSADCTHSMQQLCRDHHSVMMTAQRAECSHQYNCTLAERGTFVISPGKPLHVCALSFLSDLAHGAFRVQWFMPL